MTHRPYIHISVIWYDRTFKTKRRDPIDKIVKNILISSRSLIWETSYIIWDDDYDCEKQSYFVKNIRKY